MENMRKLAETARQVLLGEASVTVTDLAFSSASEKKKLMDTAKKGKIKVNKTILDIFQFTINMLNPRKKIKKVSLKIFKIEKKYTCKS